jgi:hypothetical protein
MQVLRGGKGTKFYPVTPQCIQREVSLIAQFCGVHNFRLYQTNAYIKGAFLPNNATLPFPRCTHPKFKANSGKPRWNSRQLPRFASFVRKVLCPHPVQCGPDQIAIGLEESRWNPRKLGVDSLSATLQHSGVLHGVLLRNDV